MTITIHGPGASRPSQQNAGYTFARTLAKKVTVLAEPPEGFIKLRRSPQLDRAVLASMADAYVYGRAGAGDLRPITFAIELDFSALPPIDLAFDVVVAWDGGEAHPGYLTLRKDDVRRRLRGVRLTARSWLPLASRLRDRPSGPVPARVTVILHSSEQAAIDAGDIREIWGGGIRFDDVEVLPFGERRPQTGQRPQARPELVVPETQPATGLPAGKRRQK